MHVLLLVGGAIGKHVAKRALINLPKTAFAICNDRGGTGAIVEKG